MNAYFTKSILGLFRTPLMNALHLFFINYISASGSGSGPWWRQWRRWGRPVRDEVEICPVVWYRRCWGWWWWSLRHSLRRIADRCGWRSCGWWCVCWLSTYDVALHPALQESALGTEPRIRVPNWPATVIATARPNGNPVRRTCESGVTHVDSVLRLANVEQHDLSNLKNHLYCWTSQVWHGVGKGGEGSRHVTRPPPFPPPAHPPSHEPWAISHESWAMSNESWAMSLEP